jgi:hypothetical protein
VRLQFDAQECGFPYDPVGRRGRPAVGGDVYHAAVIARAAAPGGAGWPDQDLVERIAGDVADLAAVPGLERNPVDRVGAVSGDVRESGVFVQTEVIGVVDGGDELGAGSRVVWSTAARMNTFWAVDVYQR